MAASSCLISAITSARDDEGAASEAGAGAAGGVAVVGEEVASAAAAATSDAATAASCLWTGFAGAAPTVAGWSGDRRRQLAPLAALMPAPLGGEGGECEGGLRLPERAPFVTWAYVFLRPQTVQRVFGTWLVELQCEHSQSRDDPSDDGGHHAPSGVCTHPCHDIKG